MNRKEIIKSFCNGRSPAEVKKLYNYDLIAIRQDLLIYVDNLCKNGDIKQYQYNCFAWPSWTYKK